MWSKIKQYKDVLIYFGITAIGMYCFILSLKKDFKIGPKTYWEIWGALDSSFAVAVGFLGFFLYRKLAKDEDVIKLKFKVANQKTINTGLSLLRKNFTRSEIMGILGMIKKDQDERYKLKFFQDKEVLEKIQKVQTGRVKVFIIEMSQEEAKQFNI